MRYFGHFWGGAILLLPFFARLTNNARMDRFMRDTAFLEVCFLSLLLFGFKNRDRIKPVYIGIFALVSLHTFFFRFNHAVHEVVFQWFCINVAMITFLQMISNFEKRHLPALYNSMAVGCIAQSLWFVLNSFGVDPWEYILPVFYGAHFQKQVILNPKMSMALEPMIAGYKQLTIGSMGQQTLSGAFLVACLPALFRKRWAWFLPLALYGIYLVGSVMVYLSLITGVMAWFILREPKEHRGFWLRCAFATFATVIGGFLFCRYALGMSFFSDQNRFLIWGHILEMMASGRYIIGEGVGYFASNFHKIHPELNPVWREAHNSYLEVFVAFGLVGLGFFLYLIKEVFKYAFDPIMLAVFVAMLTNAMGNFTLQITAVAVLFIVSASFLLTTRGKSNGFDYK